MKKYIILVAFLMMGSHAKSQTFNRVSGNAGPLLGTKQSASFIPTNPDTKGSADSFETYSDFNIAFPPWTTFDMDGGTTFGIEGVSFPNQFLPKSFMVFNPSATTPPMTSESIQPHSGSKFAACFASNGMVNNDWLISPQVELRTNSSVSFWVKSYLDLYGLDRYRVGISTTNSLPSNFTIISGTNYLTAPATGWELNVFDLNAYNGQTVYIGIQCVSDNSFLLMVDDFELVTSPKPDCSDLFMSEYVEGWNNNKALELYNPTSVPITLDNVYRLIRWSNGSTTSDENPLFVLPLTGTIGPWSTWVMIQDTIPAGQDTMVWPALRAKADWLAPYDYNGTTPGGNVCFWNGDDAISLQKLQPGGSWKDIDIFGEIGVRPFDFNGGTTGAWSDTKPYWRGDGVYLTKSKTLIRKHTVAYGIDRIAMNHYGDSTTNGIPNSFYAFAEYDSMPVNFFDSLGSHWCDCSNVMQPVIIGQPHNQTVCKGANSFFSIQVSGVEPIFYQWQKDGIDVLNANDSVYWIFNTHSEDQAGYRCIVSNNNGADTSETAFLTVLTIPPAAISGSRYVDENEVAVYSVNEQQYHSYDFSVTGGYEIDQTGGSITVQWLSTGYGYVLLVETDSTTGCIADTVIVEVAIGNVGINYMNDSKIKIYPNPTTGSFILELNGENSTDEVTVDIYGIRDEKVLSIVLIGESKHEFSLSDRPSGVYFIRVITGDNTETIKIIKQ